MAATEAIILAAGRGQRMGPHSKAIPKGLIEVGGEPLVARSVKMLRARGVEKICLVTGHLGSCYYDAFKGAGDWLRLVHNPDFATTGSLQSLVRGLEAVSGAVLILESDILYEGRALDPLLSGETGLVLSGPTFATDEVYTWAHDAFGTPAQLLALSKNRDHLPVPHLGELTGLTRLSGADVAHMQSIAPAIIEAKPFADYEEGLVALARLTRFECHLIEDLAWAEIDDSAMLERARSVVWPRIRTASGVEP